MNSAMSEIAELAARNAAWEGELQVLSSLSKSSSHLSTSCIPKEDCMALTTRKARTVSTPGAHDDVL